MKTVEEIKAAIEAAVPGAGVKIIPNGSPSGQQSLQLDPAKAFEVARFLRDDAELALDFLSNVTGVDYLDKEVSEKVKVARPVTKTVDGVEQQTVEETIEETRKHTVPGYLETVYHLYSMARKARPGRAADAYDQPDRPGRAAFASRPSGARAEFQEREVFDLFGIVFTGHPDLRRLLMWDEFKDHPMRRITWSPTILSTSPPRTTTCWRGPRRIRQSRLRRKRRVPANERLAPQRIAARAGGLEPSPGA